VLGELKYWVAYILEQVNTISHNLCFYSLDNFISLKYYIQDPT